MSANIKQSSATVKTGTLRSPHAGSQPSKTLKGTSPMSFDTVIRNGRSFDGTGAPWALRNIGIRDGHVAAISPQPLDETGCSEVIDARGKWVLPVMVDIHTHYDVEVLGAPALSESLR